ncbi:Hypp85 [Branchiostoma lanceolatum]|uniref:Hypp85 protein n=1 Tax=Branchiostoma lanceolatum TaxID=7740 RepID=A0A8J9W1F5_BRALA|nr:Hypp85 [Branchiostoma lanceolatum]
METSFESHQPQPFAGYVQVCEVGDTTSPMAQRNFPPSFWNSAYQPPTSSLTSPHPDPLHPYTDPYHPHTSALHSHHYNPDPWHPYALGASSQSSYHQPIHHDMYSMASSSHFNPRYSSLLIQPTVRPGRLPAVPGQCDLGKPESAWTRPYGADQMGGEFPGLGTDRTENKSTVGTLILTDFSKAFDRVCHTTAINKLIRLGARSSLIPWVCNFVSNRRQRVRYQGALSQWENLTCGVAQGTLMGPLVFLAMINDARPVTENSYWKYVDDYNLGEVRKISIPTSLQSDLNNLDNWAADNRMLLNPKKCKAMHFSFVRTPLQPPVLTLAGQTLDITTKARLLGLHIRSDLKWDDQVETMVSKSSKRLVIISRLRRSGAPVADLITIYCGYIRPLLEYAVPCWGSALTLRQSASLEQVWIITARSRQSARICTGSETPQLDTTRPSPCGNPPPPSGPPTGTEPARLSQGAP